MMRGEANNKDYTVPMQEFFDHHLKGKPAPSWLTEGVPYLDLKDHLDERTKGLKKLTSGSEEKPSKQYRDIKLKFDRLALGCSLIWVAGYKPENN
jgi:hypothetical protein